MKKPISPRSSASKLASLIISAFPILPMAAVAVDADWNGSTNNVWTNGANWVGGTMPNGNGGTARFVDGGNGNTVIDLTAAQQTIYNLVFDTANAASYTIGAGGVGSQSLRLWDSAFITVGSGVTTDQTINANLYLGSSSGGHWFTISNNSTAPGQLLTFAGDIIANAGNNSARTLAFGGAGDIAISGAIKEGTNGPVRLTKTGPGVLTLSAANKYTGETVVGLYMNATGQTPSNALGGGTLRLDFSAAGAPSTDILYNGVAKGQVVLGGGNLEVIGKAGANSSQTVGNLVLYAGLSNVSVKAGEGGKAVLNLGTITSPTNPSHSMLNFDIGSGVQDSTNGITTTQLNSNGVLNSGASAATVNRTDWATNATNTAGGNIVAYTGYTLSTATTLGSDRSHNVDFVVDTTVSGGFKELNTLRFNKANAAGFTNTLTIAAGSTAALRGGSALMVTANVGANDVTINGGTLVGGASRGLTIYQYNTENVLKINSVIADNGAGGNAGFLVVGGGGKVQLNGANTFSQGVMVNDGSTVIVASESNLAGNNGTLTVTSAVTSSKSVTITGAPAGFGVGSALLGSIVTGWNGSVATLADFPTINISSPSTVSWATSAAVSLNGGTLAVTESFTMEQSNAAGAVGGAATVKRNIGLGAYGGTIDVASGKNLTVTGVVSSQATDELGGLTKAGDGTLTLSGNNTYVGGTKLNAGVLALDHAGALGTKGRIEFNGGTLKYGSNNATDYSNRFSDKAGQAFKVDTNGRNITFASELKSTGGGLTVGDSSGTGSLTLTKANSYTGETTVMGGTLKANLAAAISNSSAINVNAGAALDLTAISNYSTGTAQRFGGSGTVVAQSLTVQGGFQTHDSVHGTGTLNVTNTGVLTFANGAHYTMNIGLTGADSLVASGAVKLGFVSSDRITLSLNLTSQVLEGTTYTFMTAGSGLLENNGLFVYNGIALGDNAVFEVAGDGFAQYFRLSYGTTSNTLTAMEAIPEPGTWAMLVAGVGTLGLVQRMRRRNS